MLVNNINKLGKLSKCLLLLFIMVLVSCSANNDAAVSSANNDAAVSVAKKEDNKYIDCFNNLSKQIDKSKLVKSHGRESNIVDCESIVFGRYEIDGNLSNGLEDIEWVLLDVDEENGEAILTSKYILDYKKYIDPRAYLKNEYQELNSIWNYDEFDEWLNSAPIEEIRKSSASIYGETGEKISWETSTLRGWLNNEFYDTAFSKNEKSIIKEKKLLSKNFDKEVETIDNVFCIDVDELVKYFNCDETFNEKITVNKLYYTGSTDFAKKVSGITNKFQILDSPTFEQYNYWFRSKGIYDIYTAMMSRAGLYFFAPISHREKCTANPEDKNVGVRPAICVDLRLDSVKERLNTIPDSADSKIIFDERMFKNEKTDKVAETTIAEEDIEYYYSGGKWN